MKEKQAVRPCPACDNRRVQVLHHQRFVLPAGHILPRDYDVVWCPVCGFSYADTSADQATYDRYYADFSKYEDNKTSTGGGGSDFDSHRLRETARAIAQVVPDRRARILDIGCANGGLLGELNKLGFTELLGVDPSPACVAQTKKFYQIEARVGSFHQMPADLGHFDLIILSHVLEHVADLQTTLRDLIPLLNPRGILYLEVPDASRYRDFLFAPFQDFNTEHINHFGLSALRNLSQRNALELISGGQKNIESSPGHPYPAVFGFFRRHEKPLHDQTKFEIDYEFRDSLISYVDASAKKLAQIEERLAAFRDGVQPLIVWGTGQLTMKLLAETSLAHARIVCFVDGNPINQGKELEGIPVLAPEKISDQASTILIASLLHQEAIITTIRQQLGLGNPLITLA